MQEILLTDAERNGLKLSPENLAIAVAAMREDGCVVIRQAVDPAQVAVLRERTLADLEEILTEAKSGDPSKALPVQFSDGNIQQDPPPFAPYLFRDVLVNPFVMSLLKSVLGTGFNCTFYSGNTNLPGSKPQPVHPDVGQLWPHLEVAPPPHSVVVNLPLVDVNAHNGSTELWLGTHNDTTMYEQMGHIRVPTETLEARRAVLPPIQPEMKTGDLLVRDLRMWHRGVTNHSEQPRPMIAIIYNVSWAGGCGNPLTFSKDAEALFAHPDLQMRANYTDEPADYLHRNSSYDYRADDR